MFLYKYKFFSFSYLLCFVLRRRMLILGQINCNICWILVRTIATSTKEQEQMKWKKERNENQIITKRKSCLHVHGFVCVCVCACMWETERERKTSDLCNYDLSWLSKISFIEIITKIQQECSHCDNRPIDDAFDSTCMNKGHSLLALFFVDSSNIHWHEYT